MSTDLHDRPRQPPPEDGPDKPETPKSSLSITQVVGGALAAMTASLRRTSRHVSAVLTKVRPASPGAAPAQPDGTPPSTVATGATTPADVATEHGTWALPAVPAEPVGPTAGGRGPSTPRPSIGWKRVLIGALLMFLIAALVLTGIELATGRALSGGSGTTVGQVAEPDTRPSARPTGRPTAKPSATPSRTATAEPSRSASATPSSEPTAEPTRSSSAAPSATPTPTSTPSSAPTPSASAPGAAGATPSS
jgi:hypothetical protein